MTPSLDTKALRALAEGAKAVAVPQPPLPPRCTPPYRSHAWSGPYALKCSRCKIRSVDFDRARNARGRWKVIKDKQVRLFPDTVLQLLDRIERLEKSLERAKAGLLRCGHRPLVPKGTFPTSEEIFNDRNDRVAAAQEALRELDGGGG